MGKVAISFADFEAKTKTLGPVVQYNDRVFYVKAGKAGRVQVNINNGTYIVGAYSNFLKEIHDAAVAAGFKLVKSSSTLSTFEYENLERFVTLFHAVTAAVPSAEPRRINRIKAAEKLAGIKTKAEKSAAEIAATKAKNLLTLQAVSKKLEKTKVYQPGQVSTEKKGEKVSKEEMARRKKDIDAFNNYETDELPSWRSPSKMSADEVKYLV
jgi:hypothetical protein